MSYDTFTLWLLPMILVYFSAYFINKYLLKQDVKVLHVIITFILGFTPVVSWLAFTFFVVCSSVYVWETTKVNTIVKKFLNVKLW